METKSIEHLIKMMHEQQEMTVEYLRNTFSEDELSEMNSLVSQRINAQ